MKLAQNLTIKIKLRQLLGGEVLQIPSQGIRGPCRGTSLEYAVQLSDPHMHSVNEQNRKSNFYMLMNLSKLLFLFSKIQE